MEIVEHSKPCVAMISSPGVGHVTPLLELAKRLVTHHGFSVTFLAIATTEPSPAQDDLLDSPTMPPYLHVRRLPTVDVSAVVPPDALLVTRLCLIVQESVKSLKSALVDLGRPKALIIDIFCTEAHDVSRELGIPSYTFFTTSAAMLAFCLYLPTLDREVDRSIEFAELNQPIEVPGCRSILPEDLLDQAKNRKIEEFSRLLYHLDRLTLSAGIFLNSWEALEPVPFKALRENSFYLNMRVPEIFPIGPVMKENEPETLKQSDRDCLEWLNKQPERSVLLISLGSGGTLTCEQITEIAWGLELSQQRFIWVVRRPVDATRSGTYFKAGSNDDDPRTYLPEGFLDRTRGVGIVMPSWIAQGAVIGHPSTGAFLTHCGWNSAIESIAKGVPMIAWPLYAEQRTNAVLLTEELGVAVKVRASGENRVFGREEIAQTVRLVMEGEEGRVMRAKVGELMDSAAKASEPGGPSEVTLASACKGWKS
ncbi:hypothetical protein MLD38_000749 [Melastoma candidum]|uniref:Uncharacterized protein n=1 Tax=Melastoma candidum TaxID=119954 RepID=A0ACB9SAW1_9MYRT|nr:hypothetical protein MLD38_000749 [Melastoma candidum]